MVLWGLITRDATKVRARRRLPQLALGALARGTVEDHALLVASAVAGTAPEAAREVVNRTRSLSPRNEDPHPDAVPYLIVTNAEQETSDLDNVATTDQGQRLPGRRGLRLLLVALTLVGAAFGCSSPKSEVYNAIPSAASLQTSGWKAKSVAGMPNTISGVRQEGYLETTAPDGTRIDIQFLEDGSKAAKELQGVMSQDATFVGATIGNTLVFAANTTKTVPKPDLDALSNLLRK